MNTVSIITVASMETTFLPSVVDCQPQSTAMHFTGELAQYIRRKKPTNASGLTPTLDSGAHEFDGLIARPYSRKIWS